MGYDVHITRKENWFDDGQDITLPEWKAYLDKDKEMRLDNFAEAKTGEGATIRVVSEGLAVWTAYSGHEKNGNMAWFDYRQGNITVKNPDDEILNKMISISQSLNAKVQGDEGEIYPLKEVSSTLTTNQNTGLYLPLVGGIGIIITIAAIWFLLKSG